MRTFKDLRKKANLTPTQARNILGIARSTVYSIEDMESFPTRRVLDRIAEVYNPSALAMGEAILSQLEGCKANLEETKKMKRNVKN